MLCTSINDVGYESEFNGCYNDNDSKGAVMIYIYIYFFWFNIIYYYGYVYLCRFFRDITCTFFIKI